MAEIYTRDQLKQWFQTGAKPTQAHFEALIDSLRHMSDTLEAGSIEGLEELLLQTTDKTATDIVSVHNADDTSHNLGTVDDFSDALSEAMVAETDLGETAEAGYTPSAEEKAALEAVSAAVAEKAAARDTTSTAE